MTYFTNMWQIGNQKNWNRQRISIKTCFCHFQAFLRVKLIKLHFFWKSQYVLGKFYNSKSLTRMFTAANPIFDFSHRTRFQCLKSKIKNIFLFFSPTPYFYIENSKSLVWFQNCPFFLNIATTTYFFSTPVEFRTKNDLFHQYVTNWKPEKLKQTKDFN